MSFLTRLEAVRMVDRYRHEQWGDGVVPERDRLVEALCGEPFGRYSAIPDGVTHEQAEGVLDALCQRMDRPPTPVEVRDALDVALSDPVVVTEERRKAREAIDAAKARRKSDHEALRRAAEQRRTA